jgi:hypothetical protein
MRSLPLTVPDITTVAAATSVIERKDFRRIIRNVDGSFTQNLEIYR